MKFIRYTDGYRFQLEEDYEHQTSITPVSPGGNRFVHMTLSGLLLMRAGYAWNGANKPAVNNDTIIRGSALHDAGYQLTRLGVLSLDQRDQVDRLFQAVCLEDGMWPPRAWWVYQAVRLFGGRYLSGDGQGNKVLTAPAQRTKP